MEGLYSAPDSNLSRTDIEMDQILEPLLASRFWVRLCSIVGFIFTFFLVIGSIGMMIGPERVIDSGGMYLSGLTGGLVVAYILMALFFFMPSYFLFKFASAISIAEESRNSQDLCDALRYQKSFWKFVGILVLIYLIIIVGAIVIGILSAF